MVDAHLPVGTVIVVGVDLLLAGAAEDSGAINDRREAGFAERALFGGGGVRVRLAHGGWCFLPLWGVRVMRVWYHGGAAMSSARTPCHILVPSVNPLHVSEGAEDKIVQNLNVRLTASVVLRIHPVDVPEHVLDGVGQPFDAGLQHHEV